MTDPDVVVVRPAEGDWPEARYSPPPIGLEPHPFTFAAYDALPVEKLELWDGVLYGPVFEQQPMLVVLLSNVGLRRAVQLVPRERWSAALEETA